MGDKRLEEFFKDPRRIEQELARSRARERSGRLIAAADLDEEYKVDLQQGENADRSLVHQMTEQEGQYLSAASRAKRIQERMNAEAVNKAIKANEVETESRRRAKRDRDFWVDGLVGGNPTEMVYTSYILYDNFITSNNTIHYIAMDYLANSRLKTYVARLRTVDI